MTSKMKWLPLESNPDVMNLYIKNLGLIDGEYEIADIFSFDDELLMMIPQPVLAVVFLFPITKENEQQRKAQEQEQAPISDNCFFVKQTIGNACGTIGLLHALGNNRDKLQFTEGSFLGDFFQAAQGKTPDERAALLEQDKRLMEAHEESAQRGVTENTEETMNTDLHFVAFCNVNNRLLEFDGRRGRPVNRGSTNADTLLKDAVTVIKQYMSLNPNRIEFSACALCPKQSD